MIPASGLDARVGGNAAGAIDFSDYIAGRLPYLIGAVLILSFILLMAVFRSLLVPLKAVILNLLSIGAAYGVLVAVFQWGWGKEVIGVDKTGPIEAWIPMMMFAIVFGLSMDYEVFLLSRIKEHYDKTRDNAVAVADGLAVTARVITAAALIMVCVFMSFVIGDDRSLKMFGLGLAVAVADRRHDRPHGARAGDDGAARRPQLVDPEVARPDPAEHRRRGSARGARRARGRARARARSAASSGPTAGVIPTGDQLVVSLRVVRGLERRARTRRKGPDMTLIRVEPDSLHRYGLDSAGELRRHARARWSTLVNQVVAVRYFGPNAFAFKSEVGRLAADFANRLHADMQAMTEAVRTSTTNIAAALGGSRSSIRLDPRPITPPAPAAVDFVDVDTAALEALDPGRDRALRRRSARDSRSHLAKLQATDWEGNAKRLAVDAVGGFTASAARGRCDAAEQSITAFVRSQLERSPRR